MPITGSGEIRFSDIRSELGLSGQVNYGSTEFRDLVGIQSGAVRISDFYGLSTVTATQLGESGRVTLSDTIDAGVSQNVTFRGNYTDPVVVAFVASFNNSSPEFVNARVRNVTSTGCNIFMDAPGTASRASETVCYLVFESGTHELDNGMVLEAGKHTTSNVHREQDSFNGDTVSLSQSFSSTPALFYTLNSYNNSSFMSEIAYSVSTSSFRIQQSALGTGSNGTTEDIGWIAIEPGQFGDIDVARVSDAAYGVTSSSGIYNFNVSYTSAPDVIVNINDADGIDGYFTVADGSWSSNRIGWYAAEDTIGDTEYGHTSEDAAAVITMVENTDFGVGSGSGSLFDDQNITLYLDANNSTSYSGSGSTWTDLSGSSNNANANGPTFNSGTPSYFSFDGSNDYMWLENLNYGGGTLINEMSVFAWTRTTYDSGTPGVWDNDNWALLDFDRSEVFSFAINDTGEVQFSGDSSNMGGFSSNYDIVGNGRYNDGNWHYVGLTFSVSNQEIVMYVDGQVDKTFTANGSMTGLGGGSRRYGLIGDGSESSFEDSTPGRNDRYYDGDISEIHFYENRVLTPAEVQNNFDSKKATFG